MRRISMLLAAALFATQAFAAPRAERAIERMSWIKAAGDQAALADVTGARPIALIETNYYTFVPGEPLQVRLSVDPNGFSAPATMYLYWENRVTGERRYYNAGARALLPAGQVADLFGSATANTPVPVVVPKLNDFVLFGSGSDTSAISWGVNGALGGSIAVPSNQTGLFQYVIELRDAAGRRVLARSNAMYSHIEDTVQVSGQITTNTTWTANKRYVLNEFVGVAAPAILTIEPGTVVYGGTNRATLFVQTGAKIMADGTARRPIIMTSPQRTGSRAQKDWGSLVVFGKAPINVPGGSAFLEGLPSDPKYAFGGTDANDSSGVIRYVRLEFGGFEIQTNQEINGLTLGGVGNGTVIDYVEVLHNKDDAFEFFGGTVNAKHLLGIAFADDGLDFDFGYIGNIQFAALIKRAANDENDGNSLTESDDNNPQFDLLPRTNPLVFNVTAVREPGQFGNYGGVLRRGTAGRFYNIVVQDTRQAPLTIRDDSTFNNGLLVFDNSILFGDFSDPKLANSSDRATSTRSFTFTTMKNNRNVDPQLAIGSAPTLTKTFMPDFTPAAGSPALDANFVANPPDNGFFEQVDFLGAVQPGNNWMLSGWANFSND